jgi:hypothetical protein
MSAFDPKRTLDFEPNVCFFPKEWPDEPGRHSAAKVPMRDEARHIATALRLISAH